MITLRRFEKGEVIIEERNLGETAYIIERGRVAVSKKLDGENVHLGDVEVGETFGEMSMIDDKPRSATVTAVEETVAREIHRDEFFDSLRTEPETVISILKVLFERLRASHVKILQLEQAVKKPQETPSEICRDAPDLRGPTLSMEGLTPLAIDALPENPFQIQAFPFLIGRKSRDPLSYNDLKIPDFTPLQISRHHMEFIKDGGRIGVSDRGSYLGSIVDGRKLGGEEGSPGPIFFEGSEGTLVLGNEKSEFKFKIRIS